MSIPKYRIDCGRSTARANGLPRPELAAALDRAAKRRGQFSLVEVVLPRGVTSDTLARFVSGFKSVRERMAKT